MKTSIGCPARPSSSTTEPCDSWSRLLMVMRVRPSSAVSSTGTSSTLSMSPLAISKPALPWSGWKTRSPAGVDGGAGAGVGGTGAGAGSGAEASACSASALPQSSSSAAGSCLLSSLMVFSLAGVAVLVVNHFFHAQGIVVVGGAIAAFHDGHAVDLADDRFRDLDRQHVAG